MFGNVVFTDRPRTMRTLNGGLGFVSNLPSFEGTRFTFHSSGKVDSMRFTQSPPFKGSRATGIAFGGLSPSSQFSGLFSNRFRTLFYSDWRNVCCSSDSVLTRGKFTGIFLTANAKRIKSPEHFNLASAFNHFSEKPMTNEMFPSCKGNKVSGIISSTKAFWNNMMSFRISFRNVGPTVINDLIVPSMVFVREEMVHMFIYQTTCFRRV